MYLQTVGGRVGVGREICAKRAKSGERQKVQASRRSRPDGTRPLSLSLSLCLSLTIKAIKRREGWAPQELEFIDQHGVSRSIRRKLYV